jgi:transglutaminase-like putative cysteine protease
MDKTIALRHRTAYRYDRPVALGPQLVRLKPAPHCRTPILSYALSVEPAEHALHWLPDAAANHVARIVFHERVQEFALEVRLVADLAPQNPFDFLLDAAAARYPFAYPPDEARALAPYCEPEPAGLRLAAWIAGIDCSPAPTVGVLVDVNRRLHGEIAYVRRPEPGVQSCEETLALGRGSCRDTVWLEVQILRRLGFAARFVSGYLIELGAEVAAELHAWSEVYLPGAGWIGLDPTSGLLAAEGHIPLAAAASAAGAAPIAGNVEPNNADFSYAIEATRCSLG